MLKAFVFFVFLILSFPQDLFAHTQVKVIEITQDGFSPDPLTVDENATIIFVNKDTNPHWVASDVHPTHELYPEFDPKEAIAPGQSWPFKPQKVGTWRYHDHLYPHLRGTLTVKKEEREESSEQASEVPQKQKSTRTFFTSLQQLFSRFFSTIGAFLPKKQRTTNVVHFPPHKDFLRLPPSQQTLVITQLGKVDPKKTWEYIKAVFLGQAGSSGNIHDLAHLAGNLLYEKLGFVGIGSCSREFAFGCYHGFLDKAFAKSLDALLEAEQSCRKLDPKKSVDQISGPVASCIHGIGHGVASYFATKDLRASLRTCRKLTGGREYCFDGVFMEFVRSAPQSFFKRDDPEYPCNQLEKEYGYAYSFACGRNQPSLLMSRFSLGFDEVVQICLLASSSPFQQGCFDALGFSLSATGDVETVVSGCQKIGIAEFVSQCLQAAAGEMVFQEVPGWFEKSKAVCKSDEAVSRECLMYVERLIKEYGKVKDTN